MKKYLMTLAMVVLAACQQDEPTLDTGLAGYDPNQVEIQRQACADKGGRYGHSGPSGNFVCYENTKDANQSCKKSTDCAGQCLARSGTCAPVKPLYGCNDVLTASGAVSTLCIE